MDVEGYEGARRLEELRPRKDQVLLRAGEDYRGCGG